MSYLECSRGGLLETELLHLLGTGDQPLPSYIWSRLRRSLSAFLRPSGETGDGILDFFHRQLAKAVRRRYLTGVSGKKAEQRYHAQLAEYFYKIAGT